VGQHFNVRTGRRIEYMTRRYDPSSVGALFDEET
jgi:hypothetical protein